MKPILLRSFARVIALFLPVFMAGTPSALAGDLVSSSPEGAAVYFIEPQDGQVVTPGFTVKFGLKGMGVAPAGTIKDNTGHHHILIDLEELPDLAQPLPATEQIKHFGGGQTEAELSLPAGTHTLQLLLGNYAHVPHDKPLVSEQITVVVKETVK